MSDTTETTPGWLSTDELETARARMPILYVEAVPVRVDDSGQVISIGLLLRIGPDGTVSRTLVSGRVLHHERIRDALLRHLEKDLGPVALPRVPPPSSRSPSPSTSPQWVSARTTIRASTPCPSPTSCPWPHDCQPRQDALDLVWFSPQEAASQAVQSEMPGGHGVLLKQALGHVGHTY